MTNRRLTVIAVPLLVGLIAARPVHAQDSTAAAQTAAESWLALVDGGHYTQSWDAAGTFFKNKITARQWQDAVQKARGPLGALKARMLKSATAAKTLPGAPDGDYVVLQFNTTFEHKAAALETVTMIREADGNWRDVGYFIR